jgi:hypothetical protein
MKYRTDKGLLTLIEKVKVHTRVTYIDEVERRRPRSDPGHHAHYRGPPPPQWPPNLAHDKSQSSL